MAGGWRWPGTTCGSSCGASCAAWRANGLRVLSKDGDFRLERPQVYADPREIGPVEWVICALKATAIGEAAELIAPCVGRETRIVALMNGLGNEQRLAERFEGWRIFGGMAFVCINRGEPGVIHHLDYGRVSVGHFEDDAGMCEELAALLQSGGIETVVAPNLRFARWEKLCWNVPFNGLSVAGGGIGTRTVLEDPELRRMAEGAMREVVRAGNADLAAAGSAARLDGGELVARMFAQTEAMGDYRTSMVIDYVLGRPLEVEAILGNPVRRARELGVEVPRMEALYALVRHADLARRGERRLLGAGSAEMPGAVV
ncbi:MAG: 2-dehydropantoate 2-reductase [Tepidiforma sp.]|nr:MAG: 2-dehydropantoate 2-reductase [Tepidiforma sp.]